MRLGVWRFETRLNSQPPDKQSTWGNCITAPTRNRPDYNSLVYKLINVYWRLAIYDIPTYKYLATIVTSIEASKLTGHSRKDNETNDIDFMVFVTSNSKDTKKVF